MMSRQPVLEPVRRTHASSVIADVRSKEAASGTVTREFVPLKLSAPPFLPAVDQVVFATVPPFPVPEASATVVPAPSSNANAATRPDVAENVALEEQTRTATSVATTANASCRIQTRGRCQGP